MSEVSMRKTMKEHFLSRFPNGRWTRIENTTELGTPDINFVAPGYKETWVEAKFMDAAKLPKRADTPVRLGLKPEQRIWLENNARAGGKSLVAAKIGREWFVFDSCFRAVQDGVPLSQLRTLARYTWAGAFDVNTLL